VKCTRGTERSTKKRNASSEENTAEHKQAVLVDRRRGEEERYEILLAVRRRDRLKAEHPTPGKRRAAPKKNRGAQSLRRKEEGTEFACARG